MLLLEVSLRLLPGRQDVIGEFAQNKSAIQLRQVTRDAVGFGNLKQLALVRRVVVRAAQLIKQLVGGRQIRCSGHHVRRRLAAQAADADDDVARHG